MLYEHDKAALAFAEGCRQLPEEGPHGYLDRLREALGEGFYAHVQARAVALGCPLDTAVADRKLP